MDMGDFVVVINASQVVVTGKKLRQKMYYRHSNYPGGFRAVALQDYARNTRPRPIEDACAACCRATTGRQPVPQAACLRRRRAPARRPRNPMPYAMDKWPRPNVQDRPDEPLIAERGCA